MFDHTKAFEEAKKMDPAVVEAVRQQVMEALEHGKTREQFVQEVIHEQQR